MAAFDDKAKRLYTAAYRLSVLRMNLNEKVALEAVQTRALADQSKEEMCELLLKESMEHGDTEEGKIVQARLLAEARGYQQQVNNFVGRALTGQLAEKLAFRAAEGNKGESDAGEARSGPKGSRKPAT